MLERLSIDAKEKMIFQLQWDLSKKLPIIRPRIMLSIKTYGSIKMAQVKLVRIVAHIQAKKL